MVTYLVGSEDPNVNGIGDGAFVSEGRNGHTFAVDVPFAAVSSISVTASGNATAQGSTCAAVAL
jgi:hypothetical protein